MNLKLSFNFPAPCEGCSRTGQCRSDQEIMRTNGTLRIINKLARRRHTKARLSKEELASDHKMFENYSTPGPVRDKDLLRKAGTLTDYQW